MFEQIVNLSNGTRFRFFISSLEGSELTSHYAGEADLLLLCVMDNDSKGKCCTFRLSDEWNKDRFIEKLAMSKSDAEHLAEWIKNNQNLIEL